MDEFLEKMFSCEGLFNRSFFMCKDCKFVWTNLGQSIYEMEGFCPSCGDDNFDYAPKSARDKFIKGIKKELEFFEKELKNE